MMQKPMSGREHARRVLDAWVWEAQWCGITFIRHVYYAQNLGWVCVVATLESMGARRSDGVLRTTD